MVWIVVVEISSISKDTYLVTEISSNLNDVETKRTESLYAVYTNFCKKHLNSEL